MFSPFFSAAAINSRRQLLSFSPFRFRQLSFAFHAVFIFHVFAIYFHFRHFLFSFMTGFFAMISVFICFDADFRFHFPIFSLPSFHYIFDADFFAIDFAFAEAGFRYGELPEFSSTEPLRCLLPLFRLQATPP